MGFGAYVRILAPPLSNPVTPGTLFGNLSKPRCLQLYNKFVTDGARGLALEGKEENA